MSIVPNDGGPIINSGIFANVALFDIRGAEPIAFEPMGGWTACGTTGTVFEDISIADDFADYDEAVGEPVSIENVQSCFVTVSQAALKGKGKKKRK